MQGSSRASAAHGQRALDALLLGGPGRTVSYAGLADELFSVCAALESSASLRRALTDPTREAAAKAQLTQRLFGDKLGAPAVQLVTTLVEQRWSSERDLVDTVEDFAVQSLAAGAEARGRSDSVEDELFRFERIVAGTASLRDAVTDRKADPATRAKVVATLLEGKAQPETVRLARQAVLAPRGRRFDRVIAGYLSIIAARREQLSATVTSAIELDADQSRRLVAALTRIYGKPVHLKVVLDPAIVGGIRVQIGDEVVDGTVLRKLEGARRHLGG